MWHKLREEGRLGLDEGKMSMLYGTCSQHEALEEMASLVNIWLCTNRPVLQQCKQRATDERLRRSAARRGAPTGGSDDEATIRSAGDEASIGDDATVTSDISDADLDIEIDFFEGIDT